MSRRRRNNAEFKAKVAFEALKGIESVQVIAAQYGVHPTQDTRSPRGKSPSPPPCAWRPYSHIPGNFSRDAIPPSPNGEWGGLGINVHGRPQGDQPRPAKRCVHKLVQRTSTHRRQEHCAGRKTRPRRFLKEAPLHPPIERARSCDRRRPQPPRALRLDAAGRAARPSSCCGRR